MESLNLDDSYSSPTPRLPSTPRTRGISIKRIGSAVAASTLAFITITLAWQVGQQTGYKQGREDGYDSGAKREQREQDMFHQGDREMVRMATMLAVEALHGTPLMEAGTIPTADGSGGVRNRTRTPADQAAALRQLGDIALTAGDPVSAYEIYRAGLSLAEKEGMGVERGRFLVCQAKIAINNGDLPGARKLVASGEKLLGAGDGASARQQQGARAKAEAEAREEAQRVLDEVAHREGGNSGAKPSSAR
jgi:hypothetical protein